MPISAEKIHIHRLVRGDRRQWEQFVTTSSPIIYSILKKTLLAAGHNGDEAGDLLQELFLKLCRNNFAILQSYKPERARLSTWLGVIARNMAIDHLRRSRPPSLSLDETRLPLPELSEENEKITLPFDLLPPRQMLIMKLLYEKELTVRETAEMLSIKEQSVRSSRHKAVLALKSYFAAIKEKEEGMFQPPEP